MLCRIVRLTESPNACGRGRHIARCGDIDDGQLCNCGVCRGLQVPRTQQHCERRPERPPRLELQPKPAAWVALPVRPIDLAPRTCVHPARNDDLGPISKVQLRGAPGRLLRRISCESSAGSVVGEPSQQVARVVRRIGPAPIRQGEHARQEVGPLWQGGRHRQRHLLREQCKDVVNGGEDTQRGTRVVDGALQPNDHRASSHASGGARRGGRHDAIRIHPAK
mmetsp:Transcript_21061/g.45203  ORF Transcript_21061/g.45203 Transcript_21061/m.45203 type:complete len:222 (+) Transcript_21061:352-1017(+)